MPAAPTIDPRMQAALARLTDNEKECLRRRLRQQTAKEMARDLGVSPHAVEKRLKMARTKLGLSSSLEAARLLVASEGYQRTGPRAPAPASAVHHEPVGRHWLAGATLIGFFLTAALAFVLQSSGGTNADSLHGSSSSQPAAREATHPLVPGNVPLARPEISAILQANFMVLDADRSGFLEHEELAIRVAAWANRAYRGDESDKLFPTRESIGLSEERARAGFLAELDRDGDVRVSFLEYFQWSAPRLARNGIPATLKEKMNRPIRPDG